MFAGGSSTVEQYIETGSTEPPPVSVSRILQRKEFRDKKVCSDSSINICDQVMVGERCNRKRKGMIGSEADSICSFLPLNDIRYLTVRLKRKGMFMCVTHVYDSCMTHVKIHSQNKKGDCGKEKRFGRKVKVKKNIKSPWLWSE